MIPAGNLLLKITIEEMQSEKWLSKWIHYPHVNAEITTLCILLYTETSKEIKMQFIVDQHSRHNKQCIIQLNRCLYEHASQQMSKRNNKKRGGEEYDTQEKDQHGMVGWLLIDACPKSTLSIYHIKHVYKRKFCLLCGQDLDDQLISYKIDLPSSNPYFLF